MAQPRCRLSPEPWLMVEEQFDQRRIPHHETLFTLANGYAGVRGSVETTPLLGTPGFYVAGVFDRVEGFVHEIVNLPCWLGIDVNMDGFDFDLRKGTVLEYRRVLDMRQGLLFTHIVWCDDAKRRFRWESWRLMHKAEPHVALTWGRVTALDCSGTLSMGNTLDAWSAKHGSSSGRTRYGDIHVADVGGKGVALDVTTHDTGICVAMASALAVAGQARRSVSLDDDRVVESLAVPLARNRPVCFEKRTVFYTSRDLPDPVAAAPRELRRVARRPLDALVRTHTTAWRKVWDVSDVRIDGDDRAQKGVRFSIFHLASIANAADDGVSLGAKGLHGNGYRGLVFWDTEVYMLPALVYTDPAAARALLMYRYHFLPDARANAASIDREGARFPWNSSVTGREHLWAGWQEHVSPGIAHGVDQYVAATGDRAFYLEFGARLIIETALYWPTRVELDEARDRYVMRVTCGPDEIHTGIDNNMYTNHFVAWHLRRAARAVADLQKAGKWGAAARELRVTQEDVARWTDIADRMFDTFDPQHGFHEQFEGYFRLREKAIDRSMTKMQYTGPVQHSFKPTQVLQQADTVLMYHLFRSDFAEKVRRAGFRYYEPRCSHTSTLSRCVYASVAAQAGLTGEARRLFIESLETDYGPTAECDSGIHSACLGGNWQAAVMGFAGFSVVDGVPSFRPRLPGKWQALSFCLQWRGKTLEAKITRRGIRLRTNRGTVPVIVDGVRRSAGTRAVTVCRGKS